MKNLFTTNAKDTLKADALELIDDWIIDQVQMVSVHGAGSDGIRALKDLLKKKNLKLVIMYKTGD